MHNLGGQRRNFPTLLRRLRTNCLTVVTAASLAACAVAPTEENYLRAIDEADLKTLTKLEARGYREFAEVEKNLSAYPIHYAVLRDQAELIPFFVEQGYDIDALGVVSGTAASTALMEAARTGNDAALEQLLALGADPNRADPSGAVALNFVPDNRPELAEQLLQHGANPRAENNAGEPLLEQLQDKPEIAAVVERAIKREEAFIAAVQAGRLSEIDDYLKQGYRVDAQDHMKVSALAHSLLHDQPEVMRRLIAAGADLDLASKSGWTPLMTAADSGRVDFARTLLAAGAAPNAAPENGWTPLHLTVNGAGDNDYADIAALLIDAGADLNARNNNGYTPLHLAALNNRPKTFATLLEAGADVNATNKLGRTPLMDAVRTGNPDFVATLLEAGAAAKHTNDLGRTALHDLSLIEREAEQSIYNSIAQRLINAGANVDAQDENGETALYRAVSSRNLKATSALLAADANPNLARDNGQTPLAMAVDRGDLAMAEALLTAGADPDAANEDGWSPLHLTVHRVGKPQHDYADIAELLIKAGADINARNNDGNTPLRIAVLYNKPKTLAKLLAANADPNLASNSGWTALMAATDQGEAAMVKALLNAGADPNIALEDGWTPLHLTVNQSDNPEHDYPDIARLLIAAGADINLRTQAGFTPLRLAVANNKPKTFAALLSAKADTELANSNGYTPLMTAVINDRTDMVRALLKAGAKPNQANANGWTALHLTGNETDDPQQDNAEIAALLIKNGANINQRTEAGYTPLMLAAANGKLQVARALLSAGADTSLMNWKNGSRSALDYAVQYKNHQIAGLLRSQGAISGLEEAKYPARPAAQPGRTSCNTRCFNGDCYRTYDDGRKVRFRAQHKYNPITRQWEWDSGTC